MSEADGRRSPGDDDDDDGHASHRRAAARALREAGFTVVEADEAGDDDDDDDAAGGRRWRALLDAVPHAVITLDRRDGCVLRCNEAARALLGARCGVSAGSTTLAALVRAAHGELAARRLGALVAAGAPARAEAVALGERWFDATLAPLDPPNSVPGEDVLTLTETTAVHARRGASGPRDDAAGASQQGAVIHEAPPPVPLTTTAEAPEGARLVTTAGAGQGPDDALAGVRALVLDDDDASRALLASALRRRGAAVDEAPSVDAALGAFARRRPDVVVAVVGGAPHVDGVALLREIRARGAAHGGMVPAVALTAFAAAADTRRALLAGFQLHASKHTDVADLVGRVAKLIAWSSARG